MNTYDITVLNTAIFSNNLLLFEQRRQQQQASAVTIAAVTTCVGSQTDLRAVIVTHKRSSKSKFNENYNKFILKKVMTISNHSKDSRPTSLSSN